MVERRRDPGDRRAWQIFLTAKALPLIDRLHGIGEDMIADALAGIPEATRTILFETLERIQGNLSDTPKGKEASHG